MGKRKQPLGPHKKICAIHKNFNEDKVLLDINNLVDLIYIDIPEYSRKNDLTRRKYLVDYIGLGRLLTYLRRKKIIERSIRLDELNKILGISGLQETSVIDMLNQCINERIIYATLNEVKSEDRKREHMLNFYNKLKHPDNIKELKKLLLTIIIGIIIVCILLPVIYLINA